LLAFTLFAASPAHGETGAAAALFEAGREAMKRGAYVEACDKLSESNRLEPAVGTELNLALCEEQLGRELSAWRRLQQVIDTLPREDDRHPIARQHRDALAVRLPRVTLFSTAALPSTTVITVGDSRLTPSSLGVSIPVERGELSIRVEAPDHQPRAYRLLMVAGARETLFIAAGPPLARRRAPAAGPPTQPGGSSSGRTTAGLVLLGVGGALAVTGSATGLVALRAKHEMDDECDSTLACSPRGLAAAERGKSFSLASTVTFAASGVTLAAGLWLVLTRQDGHEHSRKQAAVALFLTPTGAGVAGSFE
jgi:hypothetical protein